MPKTNGLLEWKTIKKFIKRQEPLPVLDKRAVKDGCLLDRLSLTRRFIATVPKTIISSHKALVKFLTTAEECSKMRIYTIVKQRRISKESQIGFSTGERLHHCIRPTCSFRCPFHLFFSLRWISVAKLLSRHLLESGSANWRSFEPTEPFSSGSRVYRKVFVDILRGGVTEQQFRLDNTKLRRKLSKTSAKVSGGSISRFSSSSLHLTICTLFSLFCMLFILSVFVTRSSFIQDRHVGARIQSSFTVYSS